MSNISTNLEQETLNLQEVENPNLQEEENPNLQEEENPNLQEEENTNLQEEEIFLQKFNSKFEEDQQQRKMEIVRMEKEKLRRMNKKLKVKNIHDLTLGEILVNTKNAYLDIIIELLSFDYKDGISTIFTKENRIFYIGVSLLILSFFIYILSFIFDSGDTNNKNKSDSDKINIYVNSPNPEQKDMSNSIKKPIKASSESDNIKIESVQSDSSATESLTKTDNLKINNKLDTSELKVVEL